MKTKFWTFLSVVALIFGAEKINAQSIEVSGVQVAKSIKAEGGDLVLNGAGIRSKYFMDLYVGALYLQSQKTEPQAIVDADEAMSIRLDIISGLISSEKMISATTEGFEKSTNGNPAPLQKEIDAFMGAFSDPIENGDNFQFNYVPNEGVKVYKNNTLKTTIKGYKFKKALFGIWLGSKPADKDLKEGMLGEDM